MKQCIEFTEQYAGTGGRSGKLSSKLEAFSKKAFYVLIALCMTAMFACSKDDAKDDDKNGDNTETEETEETDIIGTWTATSGKYNLS
ncbi:MAG: hypothetical protein LBK96_04295, partial [Prevotellaceae bacterium]|nr:hypothetical protein [Prevotellaceae bacterium]